MLQTYLIAAAGLADYVPPNLPPVNSSAWSLQNPTWDGRLSYPKFDFAAAGFTDSKGAHTWNTDGTRLYVVGTAGTIREYILESAYALGTMTTGTSFSTGYNNLTGLAFGKSGLRLYVTKGSYYTTDLKILQFNLTTAYDISTATYSKIFDILNPLITPVIRGIAGIATNDSGTRFYVTVRGWNNTGNDTVLSYTAGTAYEIDNLVWDGRSTWPKLRFSGSQNAPFNFGLSALHLSQDGLRLYVAGSNNRVYLYRLAVADSLGQIDSYSFYSVGYTIEDIHVNPEGTRLYVARGNGTIYQYNVSDPNDIATASYSNKSINTTVGFNEAQTSGVAASNDGRYLYFIGRDSDTLYQMEMSNYGELDSAQFTGANDFFRFNVGSTYEVTAIEFSPDGMAFFCTLTAYQTSIIRQYSCSAPFSLWGATLVHQRNLGIRSPNCLRFRPDGYALFVLFGENSRIYEFSCGYYDIGSLSNTGTYFLASVSESSPVSFSFGNYGYYLYIYGSQQGRVRQFYLPNPYYLGFVINQGKTKYIASRAEIDVRDTTIYGISGSSMVEYGMANQEINSNQTYIRTGSLFTTQIGNYGTARGFYISGDGQYLFTCTSNGNIFKYLMTTPGNVSTIQNPISNSSGGLFRYSSVTSPYGLSFSNDGRYFYLIQRNPGSLEYAYMFSCASPWQIGGSSYIRSFGISNPEGVTFNSTGTVMLVGKSSEIERRAVNGFSTESTYSSSQENFGVGYYRIGFDTIDLKFNPAGTRWYTSYNSDSYTYMYQYNTSVAFELSGAIGQTHSNINKLVTTPRGISVPTARRVFQNNQSLIQKGSLTADYNLIGSSADSLTLGTGYARIASIRGMRFSADGTKLFGMSQTNIIREYTVSSAWDISTISTTYTSVTTSALGAGYVNNIFISNDGNKLYAQTRTLGIYDSTYPQYVYEFNMGSAYSATGSQYVRRFQVTGVAVAFSPDGSRMLILEDNFKIKTYLLSTAWNISTAVYSSETYLPVGEIPDSGKQAADMVIRSDGKKLILLAKNTGNNHVYVNEYTLIVSWTPSAANWIRTYDSYHASHNNTFANSLDLRPDGQKMYILGGATTGSSSVTCFQYTLYTPT